jgi:hypothetical protein
VLSIERKHGFLQIAPNIKSIIKSVGDDGHIVPYGQPAKTDFFWHSGKGKAEVALPL